MKTMTLTIAALCLLAFAAEAQAHGFRPFRRANVQKQVFIQQGYAAQVQKVVVRQPVVVRRQRVQTYYAPQPLILEQDTGCYSSYSAPLRQEVVVEKQVGGCREFFRSY